MTLATAVRSLLAGLLWGGLAALLGRRAIGPPIWAGVIASPLIGLAVARLTLDRFDRASFRGRVGMSLVALVAGALLFSLATGVTDALQHSLHSSVEILGSHLMGVLWGIFVTGFFLFLWPLAYATCWWLTRDGLTG